MCGLPRGLPIVTAVCRSLERRLLSAESERDQAMTLCMIFNRQVLALQQQLRQQRQGEDDMEDDQDDESEDEG